MSLPQRPERIRGGRAKRYDFSQKERLAPDFERTLARQSVAELRVELRLGKGGDDYLAAVRAALEARGAAA